METLPNRASDAGPHAGERDDYDLIQDAIASLQMALGRRDDRAGWCDQAMHQIQQAKELLCR